MTEEEIVLLHGELARPTPLIGGAAPRGDLYASLFGEPPEYELYLSGTTTDDFD